MLNICICFVGQVAFFSFCTGRRHVCLDKTATYKYCVLSCAWRVLCTYLYLLIYISIEIYLSEIEGLRFGSQTSEQGHLIFCLRTWSTFIIKFTAIVGTIGRIFRKSSPWYFWALAIIGPIDKSFQRVRKGFQKFQPKVGELLVHTLKLSFAPIFADKTPLSLSSRFSFSFPSQKVDWRAEPTLWD